MKQLLSWWLAAIYLSFCRPIDYLPFKKETGRHKKPMRQRNSNSKGLNLGHSLKERRRGIWKGDLRRRICREDFSKRK